MNDIILCSQCKSNGRTNKCYKTGYNQKCGHDVGWACEKNRNGVKIITCNCCSGNSNQCYITGYDYKCGHDNGWAYYPHLATCYSCGKTLSGSWSKENNSNNNSYFNTTTGRYLGISDGYFLYGDNPNWVYSYCKPCWIKEIEKILPRLGLKEDQNQINQIKNKNLELQNKIKEKDNEIEQLKINIKEKNEKINIKEQEINQLKINKINEGQEINIVSAPTNTNTNNFELIFSHSFIEIEKIKNLIKSLKIKEIINLADLLSYNIISSKISKYFENICNLKIKESIKEIIEKLDENIEKIKNKINEISLILDEIKKNLTSKIIPENVSNESILPLKKYIEELKEKMEKMKEIIEEIYKTNFNYKQ